MTALTEDEAKTRIRAGNGHFSCGVGVMSTLNKNSLPKCVTLARYFLKGEPGATENDVSLLAGAFRRKGEEYTGQLIRRTGNRYRVEFEHAGRIEHRIWHSRDVHNIGDAVTVDIKILGDWHAKPCRVVVNDIPAMGRTRTSSNG